MVLGPNTKSHVGTGVNAKGIGAQYQIKSTQRVQNEQPTPHRYPVRFARFDSFKCHVSSFDLQPQ